MKSKRDSKAAAGGRAGRKRVRKRVLKSAEIEALIEQVKQRPILWNERVPLRSSPLTLKKAWDDVAAAIRQDAQACKSTWSSLRASVRYRKKKKKEENEVRGWEHTEALSFLTVDGHDTVTQSSRSDSCPAPAEPPQMVMITVDGRVIHKYNLNDHVTEPEVEVEVHVETQATREGVPLEVDYQDLGPDCEPYTLKDIDFNILLSLDDAASSPHSSLDFDINKIQ